MKLTIPQADFARAVALAGLSVSNRATLPVLANILLTATVDALTLKSTNLETGIVITVPAQVATPGAVTLPARLLRDTLAGIPSDAQIEAELHVAKQTVALTYYGSDGRRRGQATIRGIAAEEFPTVPTISGSPAFTLGAGEFLSINRQSAFAASPPTETSRPALTGVLWRVEDGRLTAAATDGFRLAIARRQVDVHPLPSVIIPARCLALADKLAAAAEAVEVRLDADSHRIEFAFVGSEKWQSAQLVCQLIDAKYPNFEAIIPKSHTTAVALPTGELLAALKMAALFANNTDRIVVTVRPGAEGQPGSVNVASPATETGQFDTDLAAEVAGPELTIAFNSVYMTAGLAVLDDGSGKAGHACLEFTRNDRPAILRSDRYDYVCMPMQIKGQ